VRPSADALRALKWDQSILLTIMMVCRSGALAELDRVGGPFWTLGGSETGAEGLHVLEVQIRLTEKPGGVPAGVPTTVAVSCRTSPGMAATSSMWCEA